MNSFRFLFTTAIVLSATMVGTAKNNPTEINAQNQSSQFIANTGQITDQHYHLRKDIDAKIEANGVTMFVGSGQLHYQWVKTLPAPLKGSDNSILVGTKEDIHNVVSPARGDRGVDSRGTTSNTEIYRLDVTLVGANPNAEVIFEEPTGYYENYYLAHTGENGVTAKGYQKVIYKDIYPGIDWVIYSSPIPTFPQGEGGGNFDNPQVSPLGGDLEGAGSRGGVKYDFIVSKGADPSLIRLRYNGATDLQIKDGALIATTPYGTITEEVPYTYQSADNKEVQSKYILEGNTLRFDIGQYSGKLVIDPALNWATYYGGTAAEYWTSNYSGCLDADRNGDVVLMSNTQSTGNIATSGAHQVSIGGNEDWLIVKFNGQGTLQWATYYGGSSYEYSAKITTDNNNNVYCIGNTKSTTMATNGAYQSTYKTSPTYGDSLTSVLVKFNSSGVRQWATYYGDTTQANWYALRCDANNSVWVGGGAGGWDNPTMCTNGAYNTTDLHGLFVQFNSNGARTYASYYPGEILDICFDGNGNYFLLGNTDSVTGVATTGAHQTVKGSSFWDGFIAKFSGNHSRQWGTYYGGNSTNGYFREAIYGAVCDAVGNLYVVGSTESTNNMATTGAFQTTGGGNLSDGFMAKFSPAGVRQWGTYYGNSNDDYMHNIDIGADGLIYTVGHTLQGTSGTLATTGAYKTSFATGFMAIWGQDGTRKYGTYYGNASRCYMNGVSCADNGKVYIGGITSCTTDIATTGSHQPSLAGNFDAFLVQWGLDTTVYIQQPYTDTFACTGDTIYVPFGVTQKHGSGNSFTVQLSNSSGSFGSPTNLKTVSTDTAGTAACYLPLNVPSGSGYRIRVVGTAPADTSLDNLRDIRIESYPAAFSSGSNSPLCSGKDLQLNSGTTTTGVTYAWAGPGSYNSSQEDPMRTNANVAMSGDYYITIDHNGCVVKDTVTVVVNQTPLNVTAGGPGAFCTGDTMKLTSSTTTGGVTYAWTGANNYNTQNVNKPNVQFSDSGWYLVTVSLGNCSDTASTHVSVDRSATINMAPTTGTYVCVGSTAQFTSFVQFAGTNPQLQWMVNGVDVSGATNQNFSTSTLNNGDKVSVKVTANTTCPGTRTSNEVTMTVQPKKTPSVSITANPNTSLFPNQPVTFTATPTDAGANPTYQWKRNGANVGGATSATWGANANFLDNNDDICVLITSDYVCPDPDTALSNCIKLAIRVGIDDIDNDNNINIYPNPTQHNIIISSGTPIETIEITNLLGQQMHAQTTTAKTVEVDMSHLAAGVYIIKVNGTYVERVVKE